MISLKDVHLFGEQVKNIESYEGDLYVTSDGTIYHKCDSATGKCNTEGVTLPEIPDSGLRVNEDHRIVKYNDLSDTWEVIK